jgi:ABC-type transport system involved in cytochrome c biogenesis permease subunit
MSQWIAKQILEPLASLRLTVVLFALSTFLVFAGTLAQRSESNWTAVNNYFRSLYVWMPLQIFAPESIELPGSILFPGGWLLGGLLFTNLLAAHAIRFQVSWKRAGILIIHAGLVVMMVSEFVTGLWAIEGNMRIWEGGASNYVEQTHETELAIVRASNEKLDDVTVISDSRLRRAGLIQHSELPVDVQVVRFMNNATLERISKSSAAASNPATTLAGLDSIAVEQAEARGTDSKQGANLPAAYVTFKKKGSDQSLGTYLLSILLDDQPLQIDGTIYKVSLRLKRIYKDYSLHLTKFVHEKYLGTTKPKDFSSFVRLVDPTRNEDREVRIWMNHPLRHAGETFYQSGFDEKNERFTILQVVRNPGWVLPYVSCAMVSGGMLVHFGITLVGFLRRQAKKSIAATAPAAGKSISKANGKGSLRHEVPTAGSAQWVAWGPWGIALLSVAYLIAQSREPKATDAMHLDEFAKLPVVDGGRVKPLDTVARTNLMVTSKKQTFKDEHGTQQPAIRWLLDAMTFLDSDGTDRPAADHKVFRIEDVELLKVLELEERPLSWRYSINEFGDKMKLIEEQAEQASQIEESHQSLYQHNLLQFARQLHEFIRISRRETPHVLPPESENSEWRPLGDVEAAAQRVAIEQLKREVDLEKLELTDANRDRIKAKFDALNAKAQASISPIAGRFSAILQAYAKDDAGAFNAAVRDYRNSMEQLLPRYELERADFEVRYNQFAPFYHCTILYVIALILTCVSWVGWAGSIDWLRSLNRAAQGILVPTLIVHTLAICTRMYLHGRPPITNLYATAIFIGWGCVLLGILLDLIFRNGVGNAVAGVAGSITLIIGHHLALTSGDTLEMMQAVLDTNFWLATHVPTVNFGYAATFVAGLIGAGLVLAMLVARMAGQKLDKDLVRIIGLMIYGIVCFGTFLSFTGTVLGGIWADQSWGRFWGWDPKENGALMIVIWNVLILHARWAGIVRERGMALLAVIGNIITAWSWFGVNMLEVGLHSYGFMAGARFWLIVFDLSQVALFAAGCVWTRFDPTRPLLASSEKVTG